MYSETKNEKKNHITVKKQMFVCRIKCKQLTLQMFPTIASNQIKFNFLPFFSTKETF